MRSMLASGWIDVDAQRPSYNTYPITLREDMDYEYPICLRPQPPSVYGPRMLSHLVGVEPARAGQEDGGRGFTREKCR